MMIVLVFDPLAVLLLIAANWQMKHEKGDDAHPLSEFFSKKEDKGEQDEFWRLPELSPKEETTEATNTSQEAVSVAENIGVQETIKVDVVPEQEDFLNIEVEDPPKDWEPELYNRKELGRLQSELLEASRTEKTKSFLAKADDIIKAPGVSVSTIEYDVENLQK